ncbi:MAG: sensor histidine kinase [Chloroflexota bacterium]
MSIRLRLTLIYSLILALTLIALSVVLYVRQSQALVDVVDQVLADETERLLAAKEFRLDQIVLPASRFAAPETFVQTRSLDGEVTARTANLSGYTLPFGADIQPVVLGGESYLETATVGGQSLRVNSAPIEVQGRVVGVVQMARSLASQEESLGALRSVLLVGSALAIMAAFVVGWLLAGTALRPIDRITQTAHGIGGDRDFGRRVQYNGPQDELGRLATTLNQMLGELQAAYRQVEHTLQAQRRFVADASHELRTPLTTIRGNIALLQREPPIDDGDRVAVLGDLAGECERLIRLVNGLLALARSDVGRELRLEAVAISPLLDDASRQAQLLAPDRTLTYSELPGVAVVGNPDALKQVLLILLDNALKFTPPGGQVALSARALDGAVAIEVRDSGVGMDSAVLPHVFERFYRGDAARSGDGYGLGLAIAKSLVEAQHGTVAVASELGRGSTFTITLPRVAARVATPATPLTAGSAAAGLARAPGRPR